MQISLAAARVNKGYTQQQAAEKCGISKATIGAWERGDLTPNELQLRGLASLYEIPLEFISLPKKLAKS